MLGFSKAEREERKSFKLRCATEGPETNPAVPNAIARRESVGTVLDVFKGAASVALTLTITVLGLAVLAITAGESVSTK